MELKQHIKERVEQIASPISHMYGYETTMSAIHKLTEFALIAERVLGDSAFAEEIKRARKPFDDKVEADYKRLTNSK